MRPAEHIPRQRNESVNRPGRSIGRNGIYAVSYSRDTALMMQISLQSRRNAEANRCTFRILMSGNSVPVKDHHAQVSLQSAQRRIPRAPA
jgi:hypothetical protein